MGARFALVVVSIHHPLVELDVITKGPPLEFDVERTLLDPFYAAANGPTESLVDHLEYGTRAALGRRRGHH